ncbi:hypothetical protein WJX84_002621 [Apatococcus fuscideae]|uniref:Uncharacterized protein n=1 Tax=Apatococcus fuscideae TaxID=2026836 RepID=A0AAW1TF17_9CHLO
MLFFWLAAIGWGYINHADSDEKPTKELTTLPLLWFDRQVLRRFGAFLPFLVLLYRWWINLPACSIHGRPIKLLKLAKLYGYISLTRSLVYQVHSRGVLNWVNRVFPAELAAADHMMSDHIFLTASVAAILLCEGVFLLHHVSLVKHWRIVPKSMRSQRNHAYLAAGLCGLLYLLTVGDTYYSARYFHWRVHNNSAAVLGFIAFQLPALALLAGGW